MNMLAVPNLIDGREVGAKSGQTFLSYNPANGQPLAQVACSNAEDVDQAVQAAHQAFVDRRWSGLAPWERGRRLRQVADLIRQRVADLARLDTLDIGQPIKESTAVTGAAAMLFDFYAGTCDKLTGTVYIGETGYHNYTVREPYGVVGAIAPWNFPFFNACLKVAAPLAAGNSVVIKMAKQSPISTLELGRICLEAGLPPGVLNVVNGGGAEVGVPLVDHPLVSKITVTGSTSVGKEILAKAALQIKTVALELGGKSANIIFEDADLDQALGGTIYSCMRNCGQVCTLGSRLLLQESIADRFLESLVARIDALRIGDPLDPQTHIGPMVSDEQLRTVLQYIDIGRQEGAHVRLGGGRLNLGGELEKGYFVQPTLLTNVTSAMRIAREEIFGPVISVIRFKDMDEAIKIANSTNFGLAASAWTLDMRKYQRLATELEAGIVWINCVQYGTLNVPFCGHKESGMEEDLGMEALHSYTKLKTVYTYCGTNAFQWT
jgi:betaine-aldehyde dehydrogenase